jgi:hypothetical protein
MTVSNLQLEPELGVEIRNLDDWWSIRGHQRGLEMLAEVKIESDRRGQERQ